MLLSGFFRFPWKRALFLTPRMSKRTSRWVRQRSLGWARCFYPQSAKLALKSDFGTKWQAIPPEYPSGENVYRIAREQADPIVAELESLIPHFFQWGDLNLRFAFRFQLQFFLAYQGIPFLYGAFQRLSQSSTSPQPLSLKGEGLSEEGNPCLVGYPPAQRAQPVTMVDSHFSTHLMKQWIEKTFPHYKPEQIICDTTISAKRIRRLRQWQAEAQPIEASSNGQPAGAVASSGGSLIALIGHSEHFNFVQPVLDAYSEKNAVVGFLFTNPQPPPTLTTVPSDILSVSPSGQRLRIPRKGGGDSNLPKIPGPVSASLHDFTAHA